MGEYTLLRYKGLEAVHDSYAGARTARLENAGRTGGAGVAFASLRSGTDGAGGLGWHGSRAADAAGHPEKPVVHNLLRLLCKRQYRPRHPLRGAGHGGTGGRGTVSDRGRRAHCAGGFLYARARSARQRRAALYVALVFGHLCGRFAALHFRRGHRAGAQDLHRGLSLRRGRLRNVQFLAAGGAQGAGRGRAQLRAALHGHAQFKRLAYGGYRHRPGVPRLHRRLRPRNPGRG